MDPKSLIVGFVITFVLAFFVTAGVTYLWSRVYHGAGIVDWRTAFALGLVLGSPCRW